MFQLIHVIINPQNSLTPIMQNIFIYMGKYCICRIFICYIHLAGKLSELFSRIWSENMAYFGSKKGIKKWITIRQLAFYFAAFVWSGSCSALQGS